VHLSCFYNSIVADAKASSQGSQGHNSMQRAHNSISPDESEKARRKEDIRRKQDQVDREYQRNRQQVSQPANPRCRFSPDAIARLGARQVEGL